ncbi:hypothetical protein ACFU44_13755 [Nocardia rhizosphaerihabitans]|uniref:hypothetical protein n=1 Tax=Nocardia rhizosphaerihabitans TaxID=1691570 RepID=UPI00366F1C77
MLSRRGYRTPIPTTTTRKAQTKQISFKDGVDTYKDNDDVPATQLVAAYDARFAKIGRYRTRKGLDRYSVPVGEAIDVQLTSTAGASTYSLSDTLIGAQKLTIVAGARATRIDVRIKTDTSPVGMVLVEVYDNDSGAPGNLLCRSSIRAADISSAFAYLPVYFVEAPTVTTSQVVWVVVRGQTGASGYLLSTNTAATNALTSTDNGVSWTAAAFDFNVKLYTSTSGGVKGVYRSYRPNGQKVSVMFAGTSAYTINDGTGATTAIKTGLSGSATHYRAQMVQDALYWVNGLEKPYKYDFSAVTQITAAPYVPSLIIEHKGLLFFNDVDDKTRIFYSNFADYGTYTSTDFIYVPAPKSYDGLTAFAKLNGVLYLFARRNKFQLYGADNVTFFLDEATSQRGTFSQESVVFDANYIYHADSDGIWQFNGTDDKNLALPFLEDYLAISDKTSMQLEVYNNRLYAFYTPAGAADNTECFVINLALGKYESLDRGAIVGRTFSRYAQDDIFIQASNRVAALYYSELNSNDYHNLGDVISYELRTAYNHFDTPGQMKRIPKWRPTFDAVDGQYSIEAGYAVDGATDATFTAVPLGGAGARYDTGLRYDDGSVYVGTLTISPTDLLVSGTFKRVQRRYKHTAAREPVEVDSEVLTLETQRLI